MAICSTVGSRLKGAQMQSSIVNFRGISKSFFGTHALRNVSLSLPSGHVLGLVGENGAGKSTLMSILAGGVQADRGQMLLDGRILAGETRTRPPPLESRWSTKS